MNIKDYINIEIINSNYGEILAPQKEEIAKFVTDYYLSQHEATRRVYLELENDETKEKFEEIFNAAMQVSFEVFSKNNGSFFVARDIKDRKIMGFSMGMPYSTNIMPLTYEFFLKAQKECPSFFQIFSDTLPITEKYKVITDTELEKVLDSRKIYYLGMTGFSSESVAEKLAAAVANHVFNKETCIKTVYTLSSASHESKMIGLIASQKIYKDSLSISRFGVQSNAPNAFIALMYLSQSSIAKKVVELYSEVK